jgi:hypothetical protein
MGWFARFARGVRSAKADGLMFASDRTQSHFRELRLGIGLRVTFAVPGGPGARVFRCPKTSSHALWPGSSVRTPLTGWRKPPSMPTATIPIVAATAGDMVAMGIRYQPRASGRQHHRIDLLRPGVSLEGDNNAPFCLQSVKFLPNHRSMMTRRVGVGAGICVFQISSCSSRAREP